ncbi:MAG: transglutaminase family protein [Candidatus Velthaea sp.]|jgi:transglutaminase-like putative cysteine protease
MDAIAQGSEATLQVRVGCALDFEFERATPAVFLVRPEDGGSHRVIHEDWATLPAAMYHDYTDLFGNACRRLTLPQGSVSLRYDAVVRTSPQLDAVDWNAEQLLVQDLPDEVLVYTLPSRYCLSDVLADRAAELFGSALRGRACVQAICDWVHAHVSFTAGTSTPFTTAVDVFESGRGVCRDYAHLAITFCRAMNIPARYVFGYLPDIDVPPPYPTMDFCAWFEAYLGGVWWTFDPRNNERRRGRIRVALGRDALDVAMVTTYGVSKFKTMSVWADEVRDGGTPAR